MSQEQRRKVIRAMLERVERYSIAMWGGTPIDRVKIEMLLEEVQGA